MLPRPRDFHCSSDSRARVDVQAASQQACAGEKGGAAAGERGEGRVRFVDFFFGKDELDCGLILIKLKDLFVKMSEGTWRRAGGSGAGNADVRGGATCL